MKYRFFFLHSTIYLALIFNQNHILRTRDIKLLDLFKGSFIKIIAAVLSLLQGFVPLIIVISVPRSIKKNSCKTHLCLLLACQ